MQLATTLCRGQLGLQAPLVQVEVHVASGLPIFSIVGLPAAAVRESRERVRAALINCGFELPAGRITVNLSPAELPKEGGRFDLPIALGVLIASGQLRLRGEDLAARMAHSEFYGELGLGGEVKPVKGLLLAAASAAQSAHDLYVPQESAAEVRFVGAAAVHGVRHLRELCAQFHARGSVAGQADRPPAPSLAPAIAGLDLREVCGQTQAKRALIIAAAGAHSLLLIGPPGSGKSMLAQRLAGLLPALSHEQALEVAMLASVSSAGFDPRSFGMRPFRAPHHTASAHAIVGGGPHARPGEASLAHRGVLFLDELPEFDRRVLEALREPLETRSISVARTQARVQYPAAFQLIAAMNPCPCGFLGEPGGSCRCTPAQIQAYCAKLSGPLLDRIDLQIALARVPVEEIASASGEPRGESSSAAAERIGCAHRRQLGRAGKSNSELTPAELTEHARMEPAARHLLTSACEQLGLTARSYHRALRVARTIADLESSDEILRAHAAEAVQLRRALPGAS